jgi:serine/threonine kinase 16
MEAGETREELREGMVEGSTAPVASSGGHSFMDVLSAAVHSVFGACSSRTLRINGRRLRVLRQLAEGGYSYVYLCEDLRTKQRYAVKQMLLQSHEQRQAARREIETHLTFASQPHIMPLVDYVIERDAGAPEQHAAGAERALLLFPFYRRGSLQDALLRGLAREGTRRVGRPAFFDEPSALRLFVDMATGVAAMHRHSPPLAHRDICPRNVMVADDGGGVLIDLGSAAPARVALRSRMDALRLQEEAAVGSSMPYRAPELWEPPPPAAVGGAGSGGSSGVDERTDVWSLGATLYALAFGYSPFESTRGEDGRLRLAEASHLRTLAPLVFPLHHAFSEGFCAFVAWMLTKDAAARPAIEAVLERAHDLLMRAEAARPAQAAAGGAAANGRPYSENGSGSDGAVGADGFVTIDMRPAASAAASATVARSGGHGTAASGPRYSEMGSPPPAGPATGTSGTHRQRLFVPGPSTGGGAVTSAALQGTGGRGTAGVNRTAAAADDSEFNPFAAVAGALSR